MAYRAEVLAIGTELLLGQIVDTNSAWIGQQLALRGIEHLHQAKVGDNHGRIVAAMREALERADALIVCGGGRHNPQIMKVLADRAPVPVKTAEDYGWRGDAIEAEAFAYLAARTAMGLPISFPGTTGVKAPMTGGRIVQP